MVLCLRMDIPLGTTRKRCWIEKVTSSDNWVTNPLTTQVVSNSAVIKIGMWSLFLTTISLCIWGSITDIIIMSMKSLIISYQDVSHSQWHLTIPLVKF